MLRFNPRTGTLEQEDYRYQLQDVKEPNLYRDMFPPGEIPRIPFNHRRVPMIPPLEIWITDTTFRDGQQARPPYTAKQIADLYELMHRLGGPKGIIRQCEFFLYSDKDKEATRLCLEKGYAYPEITGWIRAHPEDFKLVTEMGLKETGILTSASDYHIFLKLRVTRKKAMDMYLGVVKSALEAGIYPRCHFEDITRADFYGFVVPFAQELKRLSEEAKVPIKIRACDTMGYGVVYPGASLPRSVPGICYGLRHYAGFPAEWLEWHGHDDFHQGLSNAVGAWLYGCAAVNGTLLGLGERTGNTPIEALVVTLISLRGDTMSMDTKTISAIADYYTNVIGYQIPANQPLVGANFNVTSSGIHADGLRKDAEIYSIFDTAKILNRPPRVVITDNSGLAGIALWVETHCPGAAATRLDKRHPGLLKIKQWVDAQYAAGRVTAISDDELLVLAREHLPEFFCVAETE